MRWMLAVEPSNVGDVASCAPDAPMLAPPTGATTTPTCPAGVTPTAACTTAPL